MQRKKGVITLLAVIASFGFFGIISTAAAQQLPSACTTNESSGGIGNGTYSIEVTDGPCPVSCNAGETGAFCGSGSGCTGIEYTVVSNKNGNFANDHTVMTTTASTPIVYPDPMSSGRVAEPCLGDPITGLGEFQCHLQAIRLNKRSETGTFRLVADGNVPETLTSIVVKKGKKIESCPIKTIGNLDLPPPQDPQIQAVVATEMFTFKDCTVNFQFDPHTGEVTSFELDPSSGSDCFIDETPASDVLVGLVDQDVQAVNFGNDAIFTIGEDSCACRIIGARAYHWCKPER